MATVATDTLPEKEAGRELPPGNVSSTEPGHPIGLNNKSR